MALYSLHVSWINRKRFPFGTASAHIAYICRGSASVIVLAERMPAEPIAAQRWIDEGEKGDRRNARVVTKVMVALPEELDAEQHVALVRRFAREVTRGRASYLFAIHRPDRTVTGETITRIW